VSLTEGCFYQFAPFDKLKWAEPRPIEIAFIKCSDLYAPPTPQPQNRILSKFFECLACHTRTKKFSPVRKFTK